MSVEQATIKTRRGDTIVVSLVEVAGEDSTLLISLDDPDESPMPTAELTLQETAELREVMRKFCEKGRAWWTTRR